MSCADGPKEPLAKYVSGSKNVKTGNVDVTYVTLSSCPAACPLRGEGCYAENAPVAWHVPKSAADPEEIAGAEADAIDKSYYEGKVPEGRALRLHVSGDASTPAAARLLAAAVARWKGRGGAAAWSYTHAWRTVRRSAWGSVSVLASVEKSADGPDALKAGYAPALVVDAFPNGAKAFVKNGVRYIPCPSQTGESHCVSCKLCFQADVLRANLMGIAFEAHGARTNTVKRRLAVLQESAR